MELQALTDLDKAEELDSSLADALAELRLRAIKKKCVLQGGCVMCKVD